MVQCLGDLFFKNGRKLLQKRSPFAALCHQWLRWYRTHTTSTGPPLPLRPWHRLLRPRWMSTPPECVVTKGTSHRFLKLSIVLYALLNSLEPRISIVT